MNSEVTTASLQDLLMGDARIELRYVHQADTFEDVYRLTVTEMIAGEPEYWQVQEIRMRRVEQGGRLGDQTFLKLDPEAAVKFRESLSIGEPGGVMNALLDKLSGIIDKMNKLK